MVDGMLQRPYGNVYSISRRRKTPTSVSCSRGTPWNASCIASVDRNIEIDFVLKGALLFQVWAKTPHRPTKDLDLLGRGEPSTERCATIFLEICAGETQEDGLTFLASTITAERIKEEQQYEGVRVKFIAKLENARIAIQVDIGFGDAVTPEVIEYPTLLSGPAPRILAYPMESVIAEKVEAIAHLGMLNSRMKDFFDVWFLAKTFPFDPGKLSQAVAATFSRRGTQWDIAKLEELLATLGSDPDQDSAMAGVPAEIQPRSSGGVRGCH